MVSPRVSVLMAVHNGERYLREAVDSVLTQTYSDFEFIVVDDASTDDSPSILGSYGDSRLRVIRNERNLGLTASLCRGLRAARGELIARQDDDDLSMSSRLAKQVVYLDSRPEVVLLGSRVDLIDWRGRPLGRERTYRAVTPDGVRWQLLFGNPFVHSAVMFRREIIADRLGGYDERMRFNQDFELWSRVIAAFAAANHAEALVRHRVHNTSLTRRPGADLDRLKALNHEANLAVQRGNVISILGSEALGRVWPVLWTSIAKGALHDQPAEAERAAGLISEMETIYVSRLGARSRDVARVTAAARAFLADYLVARGKRLAGLKLYAVAAGQAPVVAARYAPRIAARAVAGQRVIARMRRFRSGPD